MPKRKRKRKQQPVAAAAEHKHASEALAHICREIREQYKQRELAVFRACREQLHRDATLPIVIAYDGEHTLNLEERILRHAWRLKDCRLALTELRETARHCPCIRSYVDRVSGEGNVFRMSVALTRGIALACQRALCYDDHFSKLQDPVRNPCSCLCGTPVYAGSYCIVAIVLTLFVYSACRHHNTTMPKSKEAEALGNFCTLAASLERARERILLVSLDLPRCLRQLVLAYDDTVTHCLESELLRYAWANYPSRNVVVAQLQADAKACPLMDAYVQYVLLLSQQVRVSEGPAERIVYETSCLRFALTPSPPIACQRMSCFIAACVCDSPVILYGYRS